MSNVNKRRLFESRQERDARQKAVAQVIAFIIFAPFLVLAGAWVVAVIKIF